MRTRQDLESYIESSSYLYEEVADGTWVIRDRDLPGERIVVRADDEFVVFRLKVLSLAEVKDPPGLFRKLLDLNANGLMHGAYAVAGEDVVLTNAHRLATLDREEFCGTIDEFTLAIATHRDQLSPFRA